MKKLFYFLLSIVVITLGLGLTTSALSAQGGVKTDKNTLTIFNWGEYIDPALLTKFEKQTGYHVNYVTFDSNEAMYTKVKQGGTGYDIIVPSDYMVQKMADEGLLVKLDKSKLTGLGHIDQNLLNPSFDKGNHYSLPYFWGTLGIVYNDKYIKNPPSTWSDLWSSKYRNQILLTDSSRDVMAMALLDQGYSVNTTKQSELDAAYKRLTELTPNVKAVLGDEIMNYMTNNETPLAVVYSGQGAEMVGANSHLHYIAPERTNIWYDNLAIPKTVKNLPAAYAFINFMNVPENAKKNAEYVGYSTPNATAMKLLPKDVTSDKAFYPDDSTLANDEAYSNLNPYWTGVYNDLYLQFKMNKS